MLLDSVSSIYRAGNYYPDTLLISPYKLDCGIPAADGLDNSFRIYNILQIYTPSIGGVMLR